MHLAPSSRAAAKRLASSLQRARPPALPAAHRSYSSTPADPAPPSPKGKSSSSNAPLAFALGAALSGGLAYYLATPSRDPAAAQNRPRADLNTQYGSPADFKQAIAELRQVFADADAVTTDVEDLEEHGFSENDYHPSSHPSVVVWPASTADVVKVVQIAVKYRMPVIPYSGATSLEGHFRAPAVGGICVDLSKMDNIIEIHESDSDVVCQPGLRWMDLNETLKKKGIPLFFPLDPAPGATIGGMLSTGCSGTNAVRYGTAKAEWFLNATVVLPSGEVIKTRRRARKSSAGFDTTKLFIGAEGTLGIVTEVTIRLAPLLPTNVAVVQFPDVRSATEAVIEVVNAGVGIQCVELCDDQFMRATNIYGQSSRKWPEKDSLFFKFQGPTPRALKETADIVKAVTAKHGATGFSLARSDQEAHDLWMDRKNALYSSLAILPGARGWSTDVCVPVSRLPELVYETKKDLEEHGLLSTIVGHVGDGNFHALLLFRNDQELEKAHAAVDRMVKRAIALDGTCE
ncbi:D-lactate dehydrogenase [cytochrome], mitochondrial [Trametes pubescens]|uniref:D-lactate dehydrogenase (cytochrome) n=1 Tax=Trametes pubescens TaxID=154538 RepID=A0A1M2VZ80_TRAPU|nr:D-lactate dehydrogenase [cytochrome], mitochondrial [Trametes pubescens]